MNSAKSILCGILLLVFCSFTFSSYRIIPVVTLGGKTEGLITASKFSTLSSLDIHSTRSSNCSIHQYKLYHLSLTASLEEFDGGDCGFSTSIKDCLKRAEAGDKYVFLNVKVVCEGDDKAIKVNNLNFSIK